MAGRAGVRRPFLPLSPGQIQAQSAGDPAVRTGVSCQLSGFWGAAPPLANCQYHSLETGKRGPGKPRWTSRRRLQGEARLRLRAPNQSEVRERSSSFSFPRCLLAGRVFKPQKVLDK